MLHQLIFAAPKPGMSEKDFQDYWVHKHAVDFASKIPGFRMYTVGTRIAMPDETEPPLFSGCAEIWFDDEAALMTALQSPEFINGARADEPTWAAFWQSIALNTHTHEVLPGPPLDRDSSMIKMIVAVKRKPGMSVADFHRYMLETHAPKVLAVPGLRRYHQCLVPEGFYDVAETPLDAVGLLWFDDVAALQAALESPEFREGLAADAEQCFDPKYIHSMVVEEHWIIGPVPAPAGS